MLNFNGIRRIFLARSATDMRRGIDSLSALVASQLGGDPYAGDCFVFVGRDRTRLKVLVWEAGGFWLCLKRLEAGSFPLPAWPSVEATSVAMSPSQMHALLEGIEITSAKYRRRLTRSADGSFPIEDSARRGGNISDISICAERSRSGGAVAGRIGRSPGGDRAAGTRAANP
jgi:transposase